MLSTLSCGKYSSFWGVVCLLLLAPCFAYAQPSWQWAKRAGTGTHQRGHAIVADGAGNTYTVGQIRAANNDFDANLVSANGGDDAFLAKYDVNGNNVWVVNAGGANDDAAHGVAIDNAGNLYITGFFRGTITFYGSPNITLNGSGNDHVFIAKYNSSGNVLWARQGTSNDADGFGVTTDGVNVYVTGDYSGSLQFSPLSSLSSSGGEDVFIASFSAATGTPNWCVSGGGSGRDQGLAITMDATGVYVSGVFHNTVSFQNMTGTMTSVGGADVFVVKYNLSGTGVWKKRAGSSGADEGEGVAVRNNGVYVGGFYTGSFNIYDNNTLVQTQSSTANSDAFVMRCNATTGNYEWVRSENGTDRDEIYAITLNPAGHVITTGMFKGTLPFGSQPNATAADEDIFVTSYDSTGVFLYGVIAGGSNKEKGMGVSAPFLNSAFVTGYFDSSPASFGAINISTASNDDIFVAELGCIVSQAVVGANQQICASSATLSANTPVVGTGLWSLLSGTGTITSPSSPNSGVTAMSAGTNVFVWTISNQSCVTRDTLTIVVDAQPTAANAGSNQQVCSATATLSGNTPVIGTGAWSVLAGTGILGNPSLPGSPVSNLSVGGNEFIWTITNQTCPASRDTVRITRDQVPTTAVAAADQTLCSSSATLSANTPTVGTGLWTLVTGTGTIVSNTSASTSVNGLSVGANVFQWTITNGVCPSSSDQVTINRDANPTVALAGNDQTICSSSATLTGNVPTTGTGMWTLISGTGIIANATSATSGVSGLSTGANVFEWRISNGTCPSSADMVIINVDAMPTTANAGSDDTHCSSSDVLGANTATTGTGLWTLVSGTGTFTNATSPTSGVNGLSVGQNIFQWTISNGVCPSSSDQVIITVDANPTPAAAGSDQTICSSTSTLTGNVPVTGTGMWTLVSGTGTIANATNATSGVSGLSTGANVFEWRISNGTCPSSADVVIINVDAMPTTANAGNDDTHCSSADVLAANTATIGSGLWTLVSGTGTFTNATSPTSGVNGLSVGQNIFQWTISNGVCPSSSDQVIITVDANPTPAAAGTDQTICSSAGTLTGNTPTTGTGMWSLVSGTGTIANATNATSGVSGLSTGANVFEWRTSNGTCPSSADTVILNVDAMPTTANAGNDDTHCVSFDVLAGNTPAVGSGLWALVTGTGTIANPTSPNANVTGLSVGQNIFEWTISNGVCPSSSDQVIITVDAIPTTAVAGADQTICASATTVTGNIPVIGSGMWTLVSGTGNIPAPSTPSTAISGMSTPVNVFEWRISNGTCPSSADTVVINIDAVPTTANAGNDDTHCVTTAILSGNTPVTGSGLWTLVSGSGTFTNATSPTSGVNGLSVGQNIFEWTISNGVCPSSSDQVIITVDATPTPAAAGIDQIICSQSSAVTGNTPVVGTGMWSVISGNGSVITPMSASSSVTGMTTPVNVLVWTISNGTCPSSTDTVIIQVDSLPTVANAGTDNTLCSAMDTVYGNVALTGTGQWSLVAGSGTLGNPSSPVSGITGLSAGQNTFQWVITNGVCPASRDTVIITVDDFPTTAAAGTDQTLCSPNSALSGNTPLTGSGIWTLISGSGSIATPTSAGSAVTGMFTPINYFEWRISNGTCPSSADTVLIQIDSIPTVAIAGNDNTHCVSTDVLNGNTPLIGSGLWTLISGTGTISNPNSAVTNVSGLSVGQNIFQWTISNGVCPASDDQVIITVDAMPTTANAGNDVQTCSSTETLNGNVPVTGNGMWSVVTGGSNVVTPNAPVSGVNDLTPGVNLFAWTITNGTCPASRDTISIEYNESPSSAVAGPDISVCSYDVIMQAQTPLVGTGVWEPLQGSVVITDSTNPSAALTNLPDGIYSYTWTTQNGFCISDPDTVTIEIFSPPTQAWAGDDKLIHITSTQLNATPADTGTGTWTVIQGSAVFADVNDPATQVSNLSIGINILRWTTSNGVCATTEDDVQIEVHALLIPSGFSPNGDNVNDEFEIIGLEEYPGASLEVFNRWGGVVYRSDRYDNSWNGTGENSQPVPDDIYYYVLTVDSQVFTGFVAIKRSVQ